MYIMFKMVAVIEKLRVIIVDNDSDIINLLAKAYLN